MPALSPRQLDVYVAEAPIILAVGVISSGKTHAGCLAFTDYLLTTPPSHHLVTGRSPTELKAEVRPHIMDRARSQGCHVVWNNTERTLQIDGHTLFFIAWSNTESAKRIRGMTLRTALADEVTLVGEEFFDMLISRLRMPGSRFYGLTNTDAPTHWLKTRIDDGRIDSVYTFGWNDNPALWSKEGQEYIRRMHRLYTPGSVFHKRFILGQWAAASGLIYLYFKTAPLPPRGLVTRTFAGLDFGMTKPSAVVRIEEYTYALERRYFITHSFCPNEGASKDLAIMPSAQAQRIAEFYEAHPFEVLYADPSAAALTAEVRPLVGCAVRDARNEVSEGIAAVERLLAPDHMTIRDHEDTRMLRDEMVGYVWDDNPRSQDKPKKENDHACDAMRYGVYSRLKRGRSLLPLE
ncbi:MAG: terminase family protein [Acidobacteria bacterium]|nr:terminase family protein [Acidobacteriota bacterium]